MVASFSNLILFLNLGGSEIVLILFVILLLFGGKGIPGIAKTLGKGIREFKQATNDLQRDIQESTGGITSQINEHIQEVKKELDRDGETPSK
jgi:sec-independent protein translocase protein TatA